MTRLFSLAMLALVALGAAAQTPLAQTPAQTITPTPSAASARSPDLSKTAQEIVKQAQGGDKAGALARVQTLVQGAAGNRRTLSLAGALYLQLGQPKEAYALLKPLADASDAEPAILYNAARAALGLEKQAEGREYLRRSAVAEPSSPAARDFGMMLAREGRIVEAYFLLRPWALRHASDGDVRLMAASLALVLERPQEAEEVLSGLSESDPAIRLLRGKALVQKGDGAGAVAMLQPLMTKHPEGMDVEVRRSFAEAQLAAGNAAEAVKLLQGQTADHPALTLLLAKAQRKAGDSAAALATLKPLADLVPADNARLGDPRPAANVALEYGSLLVEAGKAQEGIPFLDKATRLYPRNPEAWRGLAKAYDAAGKKAEAQTALAKAEELAKPPAPPPAAAASAAPPAAPGATAPRSASDGPGGPEAEPLSANLQEAMRLTALGQAEPALAAIRRDLVTAPTDRRARGLEVQTLLALNRPDEALKSAQDALRLEPQNPDFLYLRGVVRMVLKNLPEAEADFRRVLLIAPKHTATMSDLAVLLMETGKKAEAKSLLEQVLQINPRDPMANANLAALNGQAKP